VDWVRLHLMVNHFPIILGTAGTLAGLAALLRHEEVEEHEATGLWALIALIAAGVAAAASLWKPTPAVRGVFVAVAFVAMVVTAYSALEGGEIVHDSPELERRPTMAPAGGS